MTAREQLAAWAAVPEAEIFIGAHVGDRPYAISRVNGEGLTQFCDIEIGNADVARVNTVNGIPCVTMAGQLPEPSRARYRIVIAPVEPFR